MVRRRATAVDLRGGLLRTYDRWLRRKLERSAFSSTGCHNYFRAETGKVVTNWPATTVLYYALTGVFGRLPAIFSMTRQSRAERPSDESRATAIAEVHSAGERGEEEAQVLG
jgi:hypothetical protein